MVVVERENPRLPPGANGVREFGAGRVISLFLRGDGRNLASVVAALLEVGGGPVDALLAFGEAVEGF